MAAYLNRTISLVTGQSAPNNDDDDRHSTSTDTDTVDKSLNRLNSSLQPSGSSTAANMMNDARLQRPTNDKSPLQIFVRAKKKINDIYGEIEEYVNETTAFINALHAEAEIVDKAERELFESYVYKVAGIREVLQRDHMKVAFFGRTSNGKSSVINAMLREKILPSGIGHTTNCFCQVEGSNGGEAYLMTEGSDEKLNVVNIKQLANALCQEKLSESSLVRIFWPRERCSLLRDDVVFVDSPGVDVSANLDDWIDNHCLNADVFVLVLNAESTMTRAEKQFFHTVSQKLSKPNIFILNNRWDASANEPECQESVKSQHTERCIDFLTKELKVSNEKEAAERVFFVSARETLQARIEEAKGNPPHMGAIAEGFQMRYFEFQDFQRNSTKMLVRTQPFEMLYSLNCQNLCADFQEDLEFKFSWGIAAMIHRFTGKVRERQNQKNQPALVNRQSSIGVRTSISSHSVVTPASTPVEATPVCLLPGSGGMAGITPEQLSMISRFAVSSIGSQGTVGGLVVAGIMLKTIGWRVLVGVGALYGCIYLYERLSWTNSAKERTFKGQYVRHATKKLKMIVDLTSANCSHQVQQELSSTFARLCRTVDTATTDMNEELKTLEAQLNILESNQKQLKLLRNKANYIQNELDIFEHNYISPQ
ncbi:hypothetical protein KR018_004584 [Drosophila ironensis]|nr:hypothetical protein KR018_004584 [Drosophila ironensis]